MTWEKDRKKNIVYMEHRERHAYWSEQYQDLWELSVESMGEAKQKQLDAESRVRDLEAVLLLFVAPLKGSVVRCESTKNPCGTAGQPCTCRACQAYLKALGILKN